MVDALQLFGAAVSPAAHKFLWLMAGIVGLLVVASAVGWRLSLRAGTPGQRDVVANLNARVRSWWWMVALLALVFVLGSTGSLVLFALLSYLALREIITLTPTRTGDHAALAIAFFVLIPAQYLLIGSHWYGLFSIFLPVYAFLLLPATSALSGDTENFLARTAKIQWAVMVAVYCISHAPALLLLTIPGYAHQGILLMFFLLTVVQLSDVMQYVFGKLFGRRKIAPQVSPSKTVEGLVGGGLAATCVGAGLWWLTPFTPLHAGLFSALIVVAGFLGGLVMSAVKRSLGAKDWGDMIEGHGGIMDRLDSVSFAAPLFFHAVRYFYV